MFLRFVLAIGCLIIALTILDISHRRKLRHRLEKEITLKKRSQEICKQNRKNIAKTKRKADQNKFIKAKRESKRIEDNYFVVQSQHNQAINELSKAKHLTNESYRKWNYSAYKYNPSKRRYEFDENLGRSHDVPKYIKER